MLGFQKRHFRSTLYLCFVTFSVLARLHFSGTLEVEVKDVQYLSPEEFHIFSG